MKRLLLLPIVLTLLYPVTALSQALSVDGTKLSASSAPGSFCETYVEVRNLTSTDLQVRIQRLRNDIPDDWFSSFCFVNCFAPDADDVIDDLPAGASTYLKVTFETSAFPGSGEVEMKMSLVSNPTESYTIIMQANTGPQTIVDGVPLPRQTTLAQNYPNPFNVTSARMTTIGFTTPRTGSVSVTVYNLLGKEVRTLVNDIRPAGFHAVQWDARDHSGNIVPTGIYVYKITSGSTRLSKRLLITR